MKQMETGNQLVLKNESGNTVTTSLLVSDKFGKQHKHVLESIKSIINSAEKSAKFFVSGTYEDKSGKSNKMYYMNRDGFSLLVMGFTGKKALDFKMEFIEAFNSMEEKIQQISAALPNFEDPAEAARAWAIQYEGRLALEAKTTKLEKEIGVKEVAIDNLVENFSPKTELRDVLSQFNGINLNLCFQTLEKLGFIAKINKEYRYWAGISRLHGHKQTSKSPSWFQPSIITTIDESGQKYNSQRLLVTALGIKKLYGLYMAGKLPMRKDWNGVYHYITPTSGNIQELSERVKRQVLAVKRKEISRHLAKSFTTTELRRPTRKVSFGVRGVILSASVYSGYVNIAINAKDSYVNVGQITNESPVVKIGGIEIEYDQNTYEVVAYCWEP